MKTMNYYEVEIIYNGIEENMIMNSYSKQEAFITIVRLYRDKLESSKAIIKIRDLSYEEKIIYGIVNKRII